MIDGVGERCSKMITGINRVHKFVIKRRTILELATRQVSVVLCIHQPIGKMEGWKWAVKMLMSGQYINLANS
jgi:hypothetical protein